MSCKECLSLTHYNSLLPPFPQLIQSNKTITIRFRDLCSESRPSQLSWVTSNDVACKRLEWLFLRERKDISLGRSQATARITHHCLANGKTNRNNMKNGFWKRNNVFVHFHFHQEVTSNLTVFLTNFLSSSSAKTIHKYPEDIPPCNRIFMR